MHCFRKILPRASGLLILLLSAWFIAPASRARPDAAARKVKRSVATNLVFDEVFKSYDAKPGDAQAPFIFMVTNTWTNVITVDRIETSCGCTLARMPSNPWHVAAGEHGAIDVKVNLEGKAAGTITKFVTLYLSAEGSFLGTRVATVKVRIPELPRAAQPAALTEAQRKSAMQEAKSDPMKIFTDPACAKCHADPGRKLSTGRELYAADCAICHDSPNRASFVPDLHALKTLSNAEYWLNIVTYGKTNTLMPPFASSRGGPLNENQVRILADYLASHQFASRRSPSGPVAEPSGSAVK